MHEIFLVKANFAYYLSPDVISIIDKKVLIFIV